MYLIKIKHTKNFVIEKIYNYYFNFFYKVLILQLKILFYKYLLTIKINKSSQSILYHSVWSV